MDIYNAYRGLRKGNLAGVKNALKRPNDSVSKAVANRWLEYQFGLKPLISDIYGSAEVLRNTLEVGKPQFVKVTDIQHYRGGDKTPDGFNPEYSYSRYTIKEVHKRVVARYFIQDAGLKTLASVGITNPALLVWELIPYSFVVDWMFPVGNWLASLDSLVGVENLVINRGYYIRKQNWGGNSSEVQENKYRQVSSTGLAFPPLGYQPSTSLKSVLNVLVLLHRKSVV
jgi:hypothetical protein